MKSLAEIRPTEVTVNTYERLRSACLEARPRPAGELGLSVLLRHGMLAWARACVPVLAAPRPLPARVDTARIPSPLHADLIDVMVAMATSRLPSAHPGAWQA